MHPHLKFLHVHRKKLTPTNYVRQEKMAATMNGLSTMDWETPNQVETFRLFKQKMELYLLHVMLKPKEGNEGVKRYKT